MDKQTAIKLHRELWGWLAENPVDICGVINKKHNWPGWKRVHIEHGPISFNCFACEFAEIELEERGSSSDWWGGIDSDKCYYCPLDWTDLPCADPGCLFWKWDNAETPDYRAEYAAMIRDLPER